MKIDVITLFPKMFESPFEESIIARAIKNKIIELKIYQMRDWAWNSYGSVDDRPFGGDVGMLIRVDVIDKALKSLSAEPHLPLKKGEKSKIILTSAKGKKFNQEMAEDWSKMDRLIFICGHYEGFDERVGKLADEEVSIGDYVLTGGELPTMVMMDATARLIPGVLGKDESSRIESFSGPERKIEHQQYTRPREYRGMKVPEVLLSGDPQKIKEWQSEKGKSDHNQT